jgi:hypothetical protein
MNVILESLLEEGGVDDDGAKGFRVSRHLQKLAFGNCNKQNDSIMLLCKYPHKSKWLHAW